MILGYDGIYIHISLADVGALDRVVVARDVGVVHKSSVVPTEVTKVVGDDERVHCRRVGVESRDGV